MNRESASGMSVMVVEKPPQDEAYAMSHSLKRVSVVMITYNAGRFLQEQLDSVLNQTYPNIELIVSDDGSSDGTWERLLDYGGRRNVTVLKNAGPRGIHGNLQNALDHARGDVIAVCDQDDVWELNKIELLVDLVPTNGLVFSNSQLVDSSGRELGKTLVEVITKKRDVEIGCSFERLLMGNCISGHAMLFDAKLLKVSGGFAESPMYDQQLGILAALNGGVRYVPQSLVRHRQHEDNSTNRLVGKSTSKVKRGDRQLGGQRESLKQSAAFALRYLEQRGGFASEQRVRWMKRLVKTLEKRQQPVFDLGLFFLLLSRRMDLFYLSKSRVKLKRLLRFCRVGN